MTVKLGKSLAGDNTSIFKKTILTVAMLAATFYGTVAFFKPLNARFALALTPESITKIFAFNLFGQIASFALAKVIFPSPLISFDALEDDKVIEMHQKYKENPEAFKALPPVMQQLIFARFYSIKLEYITLPTIPTIKEIEALSNDEIAILHKYQVINALDTSSDDEAEALLKRYIEADLPYHNVFARLTNLLFPEPVKAVEKFGPKEIAWHKEFFSQNEKERKSLPSDVQWVLYKQECIKNYIYDTESIYSASVDQIMDFFVDTTEDWIGFMTADKEALRIRFKELGLKRADDPQTPEKVKKLDEETIKIYHKNFKTPDFDEATIKAFHRRFYDLELPLPNGIGTIDKLFAQENWSYPKIELTPPQTLEEVATLHDNQLPWLYSTLVSNNLWDSLFFDVQAALNIRFSSTQGSLIDYIPSSLTVEKINKASTETINLLHIQLSKNLASWVELTPQIQATLNMRFPEVKKAPISLDALDACKLEQAQVKSCHAAFETRPESWAALWKKQQRAFNAKFKETEGLTERSITSWR